MSAARATAYPQQAAPDLALMTAIDKRPTRF
jgi:hypothetical protein